LRWKPEERENLFKGLEAFDCTDLVLDIGIPKLGSQVQARALKQLLSRGGSLQDHLVRNLDNFKQEDQEAVRVFYFGVAYRWLTAAKSLPPSVSPGGQPVQLSGFSSLYFDSEAVSWSYMAVLNSLLTFWFWLLYGDSFHVTKSLLSALPVDIDLLSRQSQNRLISLGKILQDEMSKRVFYNKMRGKVTANYDLLSCRHVTKEIDELLVKELDLGEDFLDDIQVFCAAAAGQH
jgi:hypothetical protein